MFKEGVRSQESGVRSQNSILWDWSINCGKTVKHILTPVFCILTPVFFFILDGVALRAIAPQL
jgi:hypothetical protein